MKKNIVIVIIVAVVILIGVIFYIYSSNKDSYDESKEIDLGFADSLLYLKECKSVEGQDRAILSERLRTCPSLPDQETFDKLEIIKDLKGILECESELTEEGRSKCDKIANGCELLAHFDYKISATSGGHVPSSEGVNIYDCDGNYYLPTSFGSPSKVKFFRVQLDEETINKLKE